MSQQQWSAVDEYLSTLHPTDAVLEEVLRASAKAGLPAISISPTEGRFLFLLARILRARTILEIGTLGGYSTIWLARALPPGGRVVTLESQPNHVDVARANFARAGVSEVVDVRLGAALDTLPHLVTEQPSGFDLIFIDADKPRYPEYWRWALRLSHAGTLIVADNVVRDGAVVDSGSGDPAVQAVRQYLGHVATEPRVHATVIQTVGTKGYDGLSLALVLDASTVPAS